MAINVYDWLYTRYENDLGRFAPWDTHVDAEGRANIHEERESYIFYLYTGTNCYQIKAKVDKDKSYLGCQASSRKPRAGERHTRGRDLSDGPLTDEIWQNIKDDILSFEIQRIQA